MKYDGTVFVANIFPKKQKRDKKKTVCSGDPTHCTLKNSPDYMLYLTGNQFYIQQESCLEW